MDKSEIIGIYEMSSSEQRIIPIARLNAQVSDPVDIKKVIRAESIASNSALQQVIPTIGCEIEVRWSSLFPEIAEEYF